MIGLSGMNRGKMPHELTYANCKMIFSIALFCGSSSAHALKSHDDKTYCKTGLKIPAAHILKCRLLCSARVSHHDKLGWARRKSILMTETYAIVSAVLGGGPHLLQIRKWFLFRLVLFTLAWLEKCCLLSRWRQMWHKILELIRYKWSFFLGGGASPNFLPPALEGK